MIHGKYINQGEELTDVLKVRQLSLCDAIGNISPEADDMDPMAVNILVDLPLELLEGINLEKYGSLVGDAPDSGKKVLYIGCGRILCDVDRFRFYIDQVAILPELRKQGFGEFALRMLVDKANLCGAQKVWLKLPETWTSEEAKERALKFFTGMHFKFEAYGEEQTDLAAQAGQAAQADLAAGGGSAGEGSAGEGRWMAADINDFHACCH